MKKMKVTAFLLSVMLVVFSFASITAYAADKTHKLDELNMTLTTPEELFVITGESKAEDIVFSQLQLDYNSTMQTLKNDDIYLYAQPADGTYKITVSMIENEESQSYYNFTDISDMQIEEIKKAFLQQTDCNNCTTYELQNSQALFFCPTSKYVSEDGTELSVAQYVTIINGQRIIIQLVAYSGTYTDEQVKTLRNIVDSIYFTAVKEKSFDLSSVMLYIYIGIAVLSVLVVIITLCLIVRRMKNKGRFDEATPKLEEFLDSAPTPFAEEDTSSEPDEPLIIIADASSFGKTKNDNSTSIPAKSAKEEAKKDISNTSTNSDKKDLLDDEFVTYEITDSESLEKHSDDKINVENIIDSITDEEILSAKPDAGKATSIELTSENKDTVVSDSTSLPDKDVQENDLYYDLDNDEISDNAIGSKVLTIIKDIGKSIANVFIGFIFLISYLISLAFDSSKKNKSNHKKTHK